MPVWGKLSTSEVADLIKCARKTGYKPVPRSGGHQYASPFPDLPNIFPILLLTSPLTTHSFLSYSALTGTLVIDITHIGHVHVSKDLQSAVVGGGIRLGALYTALQLHNRTFDGGICPTVGLSGFLGSGGFTMQMRARGLGVDHVTAARVVTATGEVVTASKSSHPDLFWAIRGGGGGTYGVVVEWTLQLTSFPRSAMLSITWNTTEAQVPVAQRFLEWAPTAAAEFTSQVNIYKSSVQVLGWYLGGTKADLESLLAQSGLLQLRGGDGRNGTTPLVPQVVMSEGCNTMNARMFGYYVQECLPDEEVEQLTWMINTVQQPFAQLGQDPVFTFDERPQDPTQKAAPPWDRFYRLSKSFFVPKKKGMSRDTISQVVNQLHELDDAAQVWAEWHAWNLSSTTTDSAFAWKDQAAAHLEFQVHGSADRQAQDRYHQWFENLEHTLRPAVGDASYSGYMDAGLSVNPLLSYYGANVCELVRVKRRWDPENLFQNPHSVPPSAPEDVRCV
ncbi:hypothetical protein PG991_009425 [Apiospora marii]|uniref:FAD-binding PCMH-type domain-containing protein n=2 Tax=Apiospora marii TaxID=335849 RepID=A0ABR1RIP6_9PEZI